MAQREDGKETRNRILDAACTIFAEKGYHRAKIADICRLAGSNVAAVNYYFGDKETLYNLTWLHAFEKCTRWDTTIPEAGQIEPHRQLEAFIHFLVCKHFDRDDIGRFARLYLMELANPTGLIQDIWHEMIKPRRQRLLKIIGDLMGPGAHEESVLFCEMSIISQCRSLLTVRRNDLEHLLGKPLGPELLKRLADHITRFSLAGIRAVATAGMDDLSDSQGQV